MSFPKNILVFLFVLLAAGRVCQADEIPDCTIKAEVDRARITIGDPVEYKITIQRKKNVKILTSLPPPPSTLFQIKKVSDFNSEQEGMILEGRTFILTSYRLGEFILEPVKIDYLLSGTDKRLSVQTNKLFITVQSVAGKEIKKDIRGIKSVVTLALKLLKPFAFAAACFFLIFLILWLYKRRQQAQALLQKLTPQLTPEEEAFLRLNKLFDSDLLRRDRYKDYFLELTDILNHYFEKRFQIEALESTTSEIIQKMRSRSLEKNWVDRVEDVLSAADLAKFAKWKPAPAEVLTLNQTSKKIIEEAVGKTPSPQPDVPHQGESDAIR